MTPSVCLGLMSFRVTVDARTAWLLADLSRSPTMRVGGRVAGYRSATDTGRNDLVRTAIGMSQDWLLMLDDDSHVNANADIAYQFGDMLQCGERMGATIIGPPAGVQGSRPNVLVNEREGVHRQLSWAEVLSVREVSGIGAAGMALYLPWYRENWPRGPWFDTQHGPDGAIGGADYNHCHKARAMGGKVVSYGKIWLENWANDLPDRDRVKRAKERRRRK